MQGSTLAQGDTTTCTTAGAPRSTPKTAQFAALQELRADHLELASGHGEIRHAIDANAPPSARTSSEQLRHSTTVAEASPLCHSCVQKTFVVDCNLRRRMPSDDAGHSLSPIRANSRGIPKTPGHLCNGVRTNARGRTGPELLLGSEQTPNAPA